jgi:enoyl-CoA hydratase/carnithine racemase
LAGGHRWRAGKEYRLVKVDIEDGIAVLTLDRPAKRNALTQDFLDEIIDAVAQVEANGCVAGVLQAEGPVFCAGGDRARAIRHAAERSLPASQRAQGRSSSDLIQRLSSSPTYWIAAVQGPALGTGISMICACPSAFATRDSWLSVPEIDYGFFAEPLVDVLVPLVGRRRAFDMAATGRRVTAEEAFNIGLLSGLGDTSADVQAIALQIAKEIGAKPGFAREASRWWGKGESATS